MNTSGLVQSNKTRNEFITYTYIIEPCSEKTGLGGFSDQVLQKPVCTTTEDGYRLEISD